MVGGLEGVGWRGWAGGGGGRRGACTCFGGFNSQPTRDVIKVPTAVVVQELLKFLLSIRDSLSFLDIES